MKYNPALDGVRAVAALAVVAFHSGRSLLPGGFIGVDLFFVLSGFLITTLLLEERASTGRIAFGRFYLNRALRLWPPLLCMLLAYVALAPFIYPGEDTGKDALLAAFYLTDYYSAFWREPEYLVHTWSLSVEEHFYLVWPLVVLALARLAPRRAALILIAAFVAASAWRMVDIWLWADINRTYYRFDTRLSGLILGAAVAASNWRLPQGAAGGIGLGGAAILVWAASTLHRTSHVPLMFHGAVVEVGAAMLILSLVSSSATPLARFLSLRPLVYIGTISYSFYLWHYLAVRALRGDHDPATIAVFALVVGIAIAALSNWLLEKPLRRWRNRSRVEETQAVKAKPQPLSVA